MASSIYQAIRKPRTTNTAQSTNMKLVCSQSDLSSNLSLVTRAVPSRPTHPVLGNVLFTTDVKTSQVRLTGFDLSLGLQTSFPAQVSASGAFTLPAKLLNDIVSRLPEGEITLWCEDESSADEEGFEATLTSASGRYRLRGLSATDYPDLPTIEDGETVQLPVEALLEGLSSTLFAASSDETKQVLTGVHLTHPEDSLEFAATDGHRLAVVQTSSEGEEENSPQVSKDFAVTIPARALRELERLLGMQQKSDLVTLCLDESQLVFELADQRLTSRKLEGAYPAYQQLIPRQFAKQVSVDRSRLLKSLELVAVLADQKNNNVVKFSLDNENQTLALSVDAQDIGSAKETIPAQITGETMEIAFNIKYLMDGVKALKSSEIQIQLNSSTQPVILSPLGGLKMTYLVMPVQLRT